MCINAVAAILLHMTRHGCCDVPVLAMLTGETPARKLLPSGLSIKFYRVSADKDLAKMAKTNDNAIDTCVHNVIVCIATRLHASHPEDRTLNLFGISKDHVHIAHNAAEGRGRGEGDYGITTTLL